MSIESDLKLVAKETDKLLDFFLRRPRGHEAQLFDAMRYSVIGGGKCLRAYLVFASACIFDVKNSSALRVGTAVEMVHSYSLIHDDLPCMDDDDMRRGKPATHIAFGESTAILAGNSLFSQAIEILADKEIHELPEVRLDLIEKLAAASGPKGMCGGQIMDLLAKNNVLDELQISRLQEMKTGSIVSFCCEAGAILGRGNYKDHSVLKNSGAEIGLAFQIIDDLLDVEGEENIVGKRVGKDTVAGKSTFVSILGTEEARYKAVTLVEGAVKRLTEQFGPRARSLVEIANFVISRNY